MENDLDTRQAVDHSDGGWDSWFISAQVWKPCGILEVSNQGHYLIHWALYCIEYSRQQLQPVEETSLQSLPLHDDAYQTHSWGGSRSSIRCSYQEQSLWTAGPLPRPIFFHLHSTDPSEIKVPAAPPHRSGHRYARPVSSFTLPSSWVVPFCLVSFCPWSGTLTRSLSFFSYFLDSCRCLTINCSLAYSVR